MKVVWTRIALRDRRSVFTFIEADNRSAASSLDDVFSTKAALLKDYPEIGRPGRVGGTRELVVHPNYILIYDHRPDLIRVLRILHASRKWPPSHD